VTERSSVSGRRFWLGFFTVILLLALAAGFALIKGGRQLAWQQLPEAPQQMQKLLYLVVNGQHYVVPESSRLALSLALQDTLGAAQEEQQQQLRVRIDAAVDSAFAPVHDRVGDFADWFYSLTGEYMRYAHAIGGDMGDFLREKLEETVFVPASLGSNLDNMFAALNGDLANSMGQTGRRLIADLELLMKEHARPLGAGEPLIGDTLNMDTMLADSIGITGKDINRQLLSALAATGTGVAVAKGMGALVVKKTLAKVAATKSFNVAAGLLGKLMAKSAIKGGGVLAGAGTGAAICSPTGPGALVCGAIGGLIAWVAIDKAVIELDEALNRDEFEEDIHAAIDAQQAQFKAQLLQVYGGLLMKQLEPLKQSGQDLGTPPGELRPVDVFNSGE
jgi:hypothetical protein